jgi:hypothetical protein
MARTDAFDGLAADEVADLAHGFLMFLVALESWPARTGRVGSRRGPGFE